MKKFYFTFGIGQVYGDRYQVIFAADEIEARQLMFNLHGNKWAFHYTADEWQDSKNRGFFDRLEPLKAEYTFIGAWMV